MVRVGCLTITAFPSSVTKIHKHPPGVKAYWAATAPRLSISSPQSNKSSLYLYMAPRSRLVLSKIPPTDLSSRTRLHFLSRHHHAPTLVAHSTSTSRPPQRWHVQRPPTRQTLTTA